MVTVRVRFPTANGEPETKVRAPVKALTLKPATTPFEPFPLKSTAYSNLPEGSTANETGCGWMPAGAPVLKGEPVTGVSDPLSGSALYPETVLSSELAA